MTTRLLGTSALAAFLLAWGCTDATPTSDDPGLIPLNPRTVELVLPFEEFGDSLQLLSGYASQAELTGALLARGWAGDLDAHTLVRFGPPADRIQVIPPGGSDTVPDLEYWPIEGRVVVTLDTIDAVGDRPFEINAEAIETPWHVSSATWEHAIDTLGNTAPWPEPGGGPVTALAVDRWAGPRDGDAVFFFLDSLTVSRWFDQSRPENGLRITVTGPGSRLGVETVELVYLVRSSIHPDTIVELDALSSETTVVYSPEPQPLEGAFRIGGAPAHRAAVHFDLPEAVEGDTSTCEGAPCTIEILADRLVYAGLRLYSHGTAPLGLQPLDSISIDMRPVLLPSRVRRSPLGPSAQTIPKMVAPELFSPGSASMVELPVTRYLRELLTDPPDGSDATSPVLMLLTTFEPWSLEHATFWGLGSDNEPTLRLVLSWTEGLGLP